ncbi:sulfite exporter TauE/SafE family protein [Henriciella sp. AS95]|uniref:sulfite exporter TauE/SafE family protein n=1 Tax=Henriciella sp. AS95 TaxID=3135782 RepID=UPI003176779D
MSDFFAQYGVLIVSLLAAGVTAGIAAGLFGIGGGAVIVPVLYFLLTALGYESTAMHVAVATSLATIILTSIRSVMAHNKRGAVDWDVIKGWAPWIMIGAIIGQLVAGYVSKEGLTLFFGSMLVILAMQLYFGRPTWKLADDLPDGAPRAGLGGLLGAFSAVMGIGGGTFGVSLMTVCGRPIHQAVATAAGFGVAIGLPGAVVAMLNGIGKEGLPPFSIGHVNLPAFVLISACTVTMAPVGAALAHKLNPALLRKLFGVLLVLVSIRMIYNIIVG